MRSLSRVAVQHFKLLQPNAGVKEKNIEAQLVSLQRMITDTSEKAWPAANEQIKFIFGIKTRSKIMFTACLTLIFTSEQKFHLCSLRSALTGVH